MRPNVCNFCRRGKGEITYKDVLDLKRYLTPRGRIRPRAKTGVCAKHQRQLTCAIKKARILALLPFVSK